MTIKNVVYNDLNLCYGCLLYNGSPRIIPSLFIYFTAKNVQVHIQ